VRQRQEPPPRAKGFSRKSLAPGNPRLPGESAVPRRLPTSPRETLHPSSDRKQTLDSRASPRGRREAGVPSRPAPRESAVPRRLPIRPGKPSTRPRTESKSPGPGNRTQEKKTQPPPRPPNTNKQTNNHTNKQTHKQPDRQTGRPPGGVAQGKTLDPSEDFKINSLFLKTKHENKKQTGKKKKKKKDENKIERTRNQTEQKRIPKPRSGKQSKHKKGGGTNRRDRRPNLSGS
jgi:hypothetical protein